MRTEVIHVRDARPSDIYVGRPTNRVRKGVVKCTAFGNPYRVVTGPDGADNRKAVIAEYRTHLMNSPALLRALPGLRGKRLACWCRPKHPCHADVIVGVLDEYSDDLLVAMADEMERDAP